MVDFPPKADAPLAQKGARADHVGGKASATIVARSDSERVADLSRR
ncbi:MAG: hypothetical protein V1933_02005 [Candidatus Omnitrophota bacterium]